MNTSKQGSASKPIKPNMTTLIIQCLVTIDTIITSSDPYGLFAEVISEGEEYHYCKGELHVIYDDKGNEIWRKL